MIRHRANPPPPKNETADHGNDQGTTAPLLIRWSIEEVRRIAIQARPKADPTRTSSHGHSGAELTRPPLNVPTSKNNNTSNASPPGHFAQGSGIEAVLWTVFASPLVNQHPGKNVSSLRN